jgi:outer membrane biosynthesis protein TonB
MGLHHLVGRPGTSLGVALGASALLHAGLLGSLPHLTGGAPEPAPRREAALSARLVPQAAIAAVTVPARELVPPPPRVASEFAAPEALPLLPGPRYFSPAELDQRPLPLTNITLDYPAGTQPRDVQVVARILISEDGRADEVQILSPGQETGFEQLVVRAFGGATYQPGRRGDQPVKSQITVEVRFVPEKPAPEEETR